MRLNNYYTHENESLPAHCVLNCATLTDDATYYFLKYITGENEAVIGK